MSTVDEVVRDTLAAIATDANAIAAAKWLDNRYKEMVRKVRFRHLRAIGELSLEGVYDTGTVTTTRGSTAVAGSSTQFETDIGATTHTHYYFRTNTAWYRISSVTDETNLVLSSEFAEDSVSGGSYEIVKRTYSLGSSVRWIGDFYHTRLRRRLNSNIGLDALNIIAPGRELAGNIPNYVVQTSVDSSGYVTVEVYPPPAETELLHYVYWSLPSTLTISSTIPPVIDPDDLKEGILIDLYRYEKARAIRDGNIEQAGIWRNEEKTQMTIWQNKIKEAIRTSRAADDLTFILEMFPGSAKMTDQRTAHDYIVQNWSR